MTATLAGEALKRLAGRKPDSAQQADAGEQLVWINRVSRSLPDVEWHIIEDGKSGMASYVEALIGPPSSAIALRKNLWAPLAAIGGGSYSYPRPGQIIGWTALTLTTVDEYEPALEPIAEAIRIRLRRDGIRLMSREELNVAVPRHIANLIVSSLPDLEGRSEPVLYDAIFQWDD